MKHGISIVTLAALVVALAVWFKNGYSPNRDVKVGQQVEHVTSSQLERPCSRLSAPEVTVTEETQRMASSAPDKSAVEKQRVFAALQQCPSVAARIELAKELLKEIKPETVSALLAFVEAIPEGDEKEELAQLIAGIADRTVAATMLDCVSQSNDPSAFRAAATVLTHIADDELVRQMADRYDSAPDDELRLRMAEIISAIKNEDAIHALMSLADGKDREPSHPLAVAGIEAVGRVGTAHAVNYLLQRLDGAPAVIETKVMDSLIQLTSPEAVASLHSAAEGNKQTATENQRVAAIRALRNYPDQSTIDLLTALTSDQNQRVKTAAQQVLSIITGKD